MIQPSPFFPTKIHINKSPIAFSLTTPCSIPPKQAVLDKIKMSMKKIMQILSNPCRNLINDFYNKTLASMLQ